MEGGGNIQEQHGSMQQTTSSSTTLPPGTSLHRFVALFFMCFLGFGSYFCYDNPAALMKHFSKDLNLSTAQFTLLYSLYSWPNVILCFIGGFLIDRVFGVRLGTNIYMLLTLVGQIVFSYGVYYNVLWVMLVGRFVFGVGCESLAVAQNNYAVLWFKGKELNMVFGLQLSFARVGSTVNFWVMEPLYNFTKQYYDEHVLGIVIFMATLTCFLSMLCALVLGCLDKRAERLLRRAENSTNEVVRFRDIKDFPVTFWLITIVCVAYYVAIFPFIALGQQFFMSKFHMDPKEANFVNSLVYLISAVFSPLFGLLVDKSGRNMLYVVVAIMTTMVAHLILTLTTLTPYGGTILMGLAYSLLASGLWPLVALILPEYQLGTAYGICQAVQNLGLAVISILAGVIVDEGGYFWVEIFFLASLTVALLATVIVWGVNASRGGNLNMSPSERDKYHEGIMVAEGLEREKLLSAGGSTSELQPSSDFHIRNRYLSRIGAPLPDNYSISTKGLAYRALR